MKLSISEARKRLPELVRRVRRHNGAKVEIAVHDEVVAELRGTMPAPQPGAAASKLLMRKLPKHRGRRTNVSKHVNDYLCGTAGTKQRGGAQVDPAASKIRPGACLPPLDASRGASTLAHGMSRTIFGFLLSLNERPCSKLRGIKAQATWSEIVGWVEAQSADTHRGERWVSLTLNPSYV